MTRRGVGVARVVIVVVVVVVVVGMIVGATGPGARRRPPAGPRARDPHVHPARAERAAPNPPHDELEREVEAREVAEQRAAWEAEVEQRAEHHVAGDAREGVEVQERRAARGAGLDHPGSPGARAARAG
jgi:hypothetical protein